MAESSPEDEWFNFDDDDWQAILHDAEYNLAQLTTPISANEDSGMEIQYTYPPIPVWPSDAESDLDLSPQNFDPSVYNVQGDLPAMSYSCIDPILLIQTPNETPMQPDMVPHTTIQPSYDQQVIEELSTSQFHPTPLDDATLGEASITLGPLL